MNADTPVLGDVAGSDVLLGVLACLQGNKFTAVPQKLQEVFYQEQLQFPMLRKFFPFQPAHIRPHSRALELAIDCIRLSKLIEIDGSDFLVYTLTRNGRAKATTYFNHFNAEEQWQLSQIAVYFEKECGVPEMALV